LTGFSDVEDKKTINQSINQSITVNKSIRQSIDQSDQPSVNQSLYSQLRGLHKNEKNRKKRQTTKP